MEKNIGCQDGSIVRVRHGRGDVVGGRPAIRIEVWDMCAARMSPSDARQIAAALLNAAAALDGQEPDGRAAK